MSCFSPHGFRSSSIRPKKPWTVLVSALQKKVTNAKNSKSFNCTSSSSCHRQINPEPLLMTGVGFCVGSDDNSAASHGENGVRENLEEDGDDDGVIVASEGVKKLHGVDANAEVFIEKMREYWKLERQKSVENYSEIISRFYN